MQTAFKVSICRINVQNGNEYYVKRHVSGEHYSHASIDNPVPGLFVRRVPNQTIDYSQPVEHVHNNSPGKKRHS